MKSLTISALLLVTVIVTSSFVASTKYVPKDSLNAIQNVGSFRAHRQGKGIALSWSAAGSAAVRFAVERSYDGEYYDVLGTVDNNNASTFRFKDEDVPPGYLYYRICSLDENDRVQSVSAVEVVRIVQRK